MAATPIFVIDEIVARPGRVRDVSLRYLSDYAPAAQRRGMTLCHHWISPPVRLGETQANALTFVWSVAGVGGWWKMRHGALKDPATLPFWDGLQPMIERRARTFHMEASDV